MPDNVFVPATASGLPRESVVNVTALDRLTSTPKPLTFLPRSWTMSTAG